MNFIAGESSSGSLDEAFPNRIEHSSKVSLFFVGAKQRGHKGRQSQAPKQVLGVVTLHAICEE
jgi:hypothetical protein